MPRKDHKQEESKHQNINRKLLAINSKRFTRSIKKFFRRNNEEMLKSEVEEYLDY